MAGLIDVGSIVGGIADIAGKFIKDPNKVMEFELEVRKLADAENVRIHEENLAQIEVNKEEAKSGSVFVAGWRPGFGWAGVGGVVYSTVIYPTLRIKWPDAPELDLTMLTTISLGILGIGGGQRMFEKIKGVSTNDFRSLPTDPVSTPPATPASAPEKKKKHFHIF